MCNDCTYFFWSFASLEMCPKKFISVWYRSKYRATACYCCYLSCSLAGNRLRLQRTVSFRLKHGSCVFSPSLFLYFSVSVSCGGEKIQSVSGIGIKNTKTEELVVPCLFFTGALSLKCLLASLKGGNESCESTRVGFMCLTAQRAIKFFILWPDE